MEMDLCILVSVATIGNQMAVFWVVALFSLVEVYHRCRGTCDRPDDGGSKHLWNVGKLLPDYTVLQPRRQLSSYLPLWEPEILIGNHFMPDS
jgi:hypothetical protein